MHILVVDDEKLISWSIQKLLARRGHTVEVCNRIHDALDLIQRTPFDLVISDYVMPDAKGDTVMKAVRDKGGLTKVILMSGALSAAAIDSLGADAYIEKPFLMAELQRVIDRVCQNSQPGPSAV